MPPHGFGHDRQAQADAARVAIPGRRHAKEGRKNAVQICLRHTGATVGNVDADPGVDRPRFFLQGHHHFRPRRRKSQRVAQHVFNRTMQGDGIAVQAQRPGRAHHPHADLTRAGFEARIVHHAIHDRIQHQRVQRAAACFQAGRLQNAARHLFQERAFPFDPVQLHR